MNVAGWLAVLAPGALVGFVAGLIVDRHILAITVGGTAAAWGVALIVDYVTWRRSRIGFDITDLSEDARLSVAARLEAEGISFRIEEQWFEGDGPQQSLESTMRHRHRVEEVLRAHQRNV